MLITAKKYHFLLAQKANSASILRGISTDEDKDVSLPNPQISSATVSGSNMQLEKYSDSADLRQGSSLPPYGIVRNAAENGPISE